MVEPFDFTTKRGAGLVGQGPGLQFAPLTQPSFMPGTITDPREKLLRQLLAQGIDRPTAEQFVQRAIERGDLEEIASTLPERDVGGERLSAVESLRRLPGGGLGNIQGTTRVKTLPGGNLLGPDAGKVASIGGDAMVQQLTQPMANMIEASKTLPERTFATRAREFQEQQDRPIELPPELLGEVEPEAQEPSAKAALDASVAAKEQSELDDASQRELAEAQSRLGGLQFSEALARSLGRIGEQTTGIELKSGLLPERFGARGELAGVRQQIQRAQKEVDRLEAKRDDPLSQPDSDESVIARQSLMEITGRDVPDNITARAIANVFPFIQTEAQTTLGRANLQSKALSQALAAKKDAKLTPKQLSTITDIDQSIQQMENIIEAKAGKVGTGPLVNAFREGLALTNLLSGEDTENFIALKQSLEVMAVLFRKAITGTQAGFREITDLRKNIPKATDNDKKFLTKARNFLRLMQNRREIEITNLARLGKEVKEFARPTGVAKLRRSDPSFEQLQKEAEAAGLEVQVVD